MHVVKGRDQLDLLGQQHAVAEHVTGHITNAHHRERLALDIAAHFPEMPLHPFPGAARGNAHGLVVVASRTTRGKGIVEPEAVGLRQTVGDIRERGRALVGGDHQIGVVAVATHHVRRRLDRRANAVVGDIQQPANEYLVAGDAAGLAHLAGFVGRRVLDHEPALGADRHDDRVLDHLRLHQPEHFGTEILAPVRPAQPAACHLATAQMHAFDLRRVHEGFEHRQRARQLRHQGWVELDADIGLECAVFVALIVVGAQRGFHHPVERPQHTVGVEAGHLVERDIDFGQPGLVVDHRARGVETRLEQLHELLDPIGMNGQLLLDIVGRKRQLGLQQIAGDGAHQHHLARGEAGAHDQSVQAVVFSAARDDRRKRLGHVVAAAVLGQRLGIGMVGFVFVNPLWILAGAFHPIRPLRMYRQPEVLENRHGRRQRCFLAVAVQLELDSVGIDAHDP